jgi:type II secretory pathway pseudopilin PulG
MKRFLKKSEGYTLIELTITIIVLGLVCYFVVNMCVELLAASAEQTQSVEGTNLAQSKMEEAERIGTSVSSQGWTTSGGYEWRRVVTTLKSQSGSPTLIEVKIEIRKNSVTFFSLTNHLSS